MMRDYVPQQNTGTLLGQTANGIGVDRLDTRTLSSKTVERPDRRAAEFITDGHGEIRVVGRRNSTTDGYDTGNITYSYRRKGSRDWLPLSVFSGADSRGFNPYHVDRDRDVAYGLKKVDGKLAAFSIKLDGSGLETKLFEAPGGVDVSGFARIGRRGRVVGVTYVTDRPEVHYIDPELAKLAAGISKALPNLPLIRFVDSSVDESVLLIWAGSDRDPGRYYLLDRKSKAMGELLPIRGRLAATRLAAVKPITYKAADGTAVPAYLTLPEGSSGKNLPAIVMPHGGPGARDEWGFDWLSQFFAARGFAVIQPNFRGSSGYGDQWFQKNGFQGWQTAIGDVRDAGRYLTAQGIADPQKLAIVGWSYGGYAALQTAATSPDLFRAVIAIAPVTDLETLRQQFRDWTNFELASQFIGKGPHVAEGSPARHADAIKAPVLMFHGTFDRNVDVAHSRLMARRLKEAGKSADLITYERLDHYLEDSAARTDMLSRSDVFLRKSLGMAN
jgi:dipeptidyl aminopeptidase/acylaminoacyl peptidase